VANALIVDVLVRIDAKMSKAQL